MFTPYAPRYDAVNLREGPIAWLEILRYRDLRSFEFIETMKLSNGVVYLVTVCLMRRKKSCNWFEYGMS